MASLIQQHFKQIGRNDRGVRQDVVLVLRHTSMPSVLVELGFLTNLEEEAFLRSDAGKDKLAHALLEAFTAFRKNYERKNGHNASVRAEAIKPPIQTDSDRLTSSPKNATRTTRQLAEKTDTVSPATSSSPLFFKVQLLTSDVPLSKKDKRFKGYELDYYFE
jgi:N-acetylmuramoyl-L-alanine amidase